MNNDMIKQALEDEKTFMTDPVLYRKYILAEKARMDAKARKDYIIDEAMIKVAKKLIAFNMPIEQIASATNLSVDYILKLKSG